MQSKLTRRGFVGLTVAAAALCARTARADAPADAAPEAFPVDEVVDDGHRFFGTLSREREPGIRPGHAVLDPSRRTGRSRKDTKGALTPP